MRYNVSCGRIAEKRLRYNKSDPVGIQTQDLQNRNLTLYSAKLRDQCYSKAVQRYDKKVKSEK